MSDVSPPPSDTVWWDPVETLANVLATLRLTGQDVDRAHLEQQIPAAGQAINQYLDRVDPPPGPPPAAGLQAALETATIALYHRAGIVATVGAGQNYTQAFNERFDPLFDVYVELAPFRQRWAVA